MPKLLNVIVACTENRVIGRDGSVPWQIPEDTRHFLAMTRGRICVLGHRSYASWPGATRAGRQAVVVSRRLTARAPDVRVAPTVQAALEIAEGLPGEIFVCGGQRIYEETLTLPRPLRLYLTLVHAEVPGDTFFPEWRHLFWREAARRESSDADHRYVFLILER